MVEFQLKAAFVLKQGFVPIAVAKSIYLKGEFYFELEGSYVFNSSELIIITKIFLPNQQLLGFKNLQIKEDILKEE